MKESFTVLEIDMLLWFHTRAAPFPNIGFPAQQQYLSEMIMAGLVAPSGNPDRPWRTTELGDAWVDKICIAAARLADKNCIMVEAAVPDISDFLRGFGGKAAGDSKNAAGGSAEAPKRQLVIEPEIGMPVWFFATPGQKAPYCAHIADVFHQRRVNIVYLDHSGLPFGVREVFLVQPDDPPPTVYPLCTWMPWQVDRARNQA